MRERLTEPSTTVGDQHGTAGPSEPAASASPPGRLARLRTVPPLVWVLTLLHGTLLVMFTVLYPPYIGPDEPQHVDMAVALTRSLAWPGPGERALALGAPTGPVGCRRCCPSVCDAGVAVAVCADLSAGR
jgi:hypothetical protein